MRFVLAVLGVILGAVIGAAIAAFGFLSLAEFFGISNFEGARGMQAFFAAAPLGALIGAGLGLWIALRRR